MNGGTPGAAVSGRAASHSAPQRDSHRDSHSDSHSDSPRDSPSDSYDPAPSADRIPSASTVFVEFCAAGLWSGVGQAMAKTLAENGIDDAAKVSVTTLAGLPKVTPRRAERLFTAWIGASHLYELAELLVPQELPVRWATRLTDLLGDGAAAALRRDPWRLLAIPESTVAQADRLARSIDPASDRSDARRGRALVDWTLARFARHGHTVSPVALVAAALQPFGIDAQAAIRDATADGTVTRVPSSPAGAGAGGGIGAGGGAGGGAPGDLLARAPLAEAEAAIAEHIGRLAATGRSLAGDRAVTAAAKQLDEVQARAVGLAAREGVSMLTGGPGTGKSRTISAVVALCAKVDAAVALAAPTGRAAKRLEELAGHPATTVHKLLGAWRRPGPGGTGSGTAGFDRDALHPIEADLVVVDEASMLDVELGSALLAAIPDGAHLVIVGDPAQLPSIGPGRLLGDLIDAAVLPVTELTTLYRQTEGGAIARLAAAVRAGDLPAPTAGDHEVVIVPCRGSDEAAHRVVQLVTDSIPRVFGADGEALQVVTPVHRGPAGTQSLNRVLKERLNPGRGVVRGFDAGDRVVATANHPDAEPSGFANGEVGTVVSTGDNSVRVAFPGGDSDVTGKSLGDLLHGWAITVHRAQGSEWDAVVVVLPPEAAPMLSRPLVYTALTRAKRHLSVVHAVGPALARAVREIGAEPRRTLLSSLITVALTASSVPADPSGTDSAVPDADSDSGR